jgi:hypothetical protein
MPSTTSSIAEKCEELSRKWPEVCQDLARWNSQLHASFKRARRGDYLSVCMALLETAGRVKVKQVPFPFWLATVI